MTLGTSRRIRANRRRWAAPVPVVRFNGRLDMETAEAIKERWDEAIRRRQPILVGDDWTVIR